MSHLNYLKTENLLNLCTWNILPCYVAVKNKKGKYLDANDYLACAAGYKKGDDLLGCTDFDMWGVEAEPIKNNDLQILSDKKQQVFLETVTLKDGNKMTALSQKTPLFSSTNKIIGLTALSIIISINKDAYLDKSLRLVQQDVPLDYKNTHGLSKRQFECLNCLVQGMTIKQIARQTNLSPRTVEHYLDKVKGKLHCHSRTELVTKALQLPTIKKRLFQDG